MAKRVTPDAAWTAAQFKRESLGLRFEKSNIGDVLDKVEAQIYYNYADHVMDNYTLRTPSGTGMMAGPMASNVDRRTLGARIKATWRWADVQLISGIDAQTNEHRQRSAMGIDTYKDLPRNKDADFHNYGVFSELTWYAADRDRLITGARLDRASAKDFRQTTGSGMMTRRNPTADDTRADTLPSGFVRYEHDLADSPTTLYAGLGHTQRFPDYWELFSPNSGPVGSVNAFDSIKPEKTTQLDFGLQYKTEDLEAWASGYVGQVRDYILFNYTPGMMGMTSQAENIDARIMGGELGAAYKLTVELEDRRDPGLRLGQEQQRRQRVAANAAAGCTFRPDLQRRQLERRRTVESGRRAKPHRPEQGQRGRQGLRQDLGVRRVLAQRRVPDQQELEGQQRRRQPVRQGLRRAFEPGRQRRFWLPGQ